MQFNKINEGDISISINGPLEPYKFEYIIDSTTGYDVNSTGKQFRIKMKFLTHLHGEYLETITVNINNQMIIKDQDNNNLQTQIMEVQVPFDLTVLSDEEKQEASGQSSFSIISLIMTFGTSILIQLVLGNSIEATWLLLGTLQLMSFLPLLSLNLPVNFREFSKNLAVLNGEPQALPNLFEYFYDSINAVKEPYNKYFEFMNFKTVFLLLNAGRKIETWILIFIISCIIWVLMDF